MGNSTSKARGALALAVVAVAPLLACTSAAAEPMIAGTPARVTPGQAVVLQASGFLAGERVSIELQPTDDELANSDAVAPLTDLPVASDGTAELRFLWPAGYYNGCTAVYCPRHPNNPWLNQQEVNIDVTSEASEGELGSLVQTRTSIALAHGSKRCGHVAVAPHPPLAKVRVVHGGLRCSTARSLMRHAFPTVHTGRPITENDTLGELWRVGGWLCAGGLGQSEIFCFRGAEQVDGSGRNDDGWVF
jgi:hypothetical protein